MREQLLALAKLGQIDASTRQLDAKLKAAPAEVEDLRENVGVLEGLLAKERGQLTDAQALRDDQDAKIKEAQETLARSKAKAAKASNAREADAVERELDAVRRSMREREQERDKLTAAIEKVAGSLAKHEEEFGGLRDVLAEKDAEAQKLVAELMAERDIAWAGREDLTKLLPAPILRRYEKLRERYGMATAHAENGTCAGCRMALRPMQFIAIQRVESFEQCAHCMRLLVDLAWLDETAPAEKADESPASGETGES